MDTGKTKVVKPEGGEREFFARALGGQIEIVFCDGSITHGELLNIGRYTLIVEVEGRQALLYKHFIVSIRRLSGE